MSEAVHSARRAVALLFGVLALLSGCERGTSLVSVSTQKEAIEILVELDAYGISDATMRSITKGRESTFEISVPAAEVSSARKLLLSRDLPRIPTSGLEVYTSGGAIIPTPTDERAKLMHAISGELEQTLENVNGVTRARVHIVLPEKDSLGATTPSDPKASVLLVVSKPAEQRGGSTGEGVPSGPSPDMGRASPFEYFIVEHAAASSDPQSTGSNRKPTSDALAEVVARIVANAVPMLKRENVSVVMSFEPTVSFPTLASRPSAELATVSGTAQILFIACVVLTALFIAACSWALWLKRRQVAQT